MGVRDRQKYGQTDRDTKRLIGYGKKMQDNQMTSMDSQRDRLDKLLTLVTLAAVVAPATTALASHVITNHMVVTFTASGTVQAKRPRRALWERHTPNTSKTKNTEGWEMEGVVWVGGVGEG